MTQLSLTPTLINTRPPRACFPHTEFVAGLGHVVPSAEISALEASIYQLLANNSLKYAVLGLNTVERLEERNVLSDDEAVLCDLELVAYNKKNDGQKHSDNIDNETDDDDDDDDDDEDDDIMMTMMGMIGDRDKENDGEQNEEDGHKNVIKFTALEHGILNIHPDHEIDYDHILLGSQFALSSSVYKIVLESEKAQSSSSSSSASSNKKKQQQAPKMYTLPFQQLMAMDTVISLVEQTGVMVQYLSTLLMQLRQDIGAPWMTAFQMHQYRKLVQCHRINAYNVKRRIGKTTGVYSELVKSLLCFPEARVKGLYIVHSPQAAQSCRTAVVCALGNLVPIFNNLQFRKYEERLRIRRALNNAKDNENDYFYKCELFKTLSKPSKGKKKTMVAAAGGGNGDDEVMSRGDELAGVGAVCGQEIGVKFSKCTGNEDQEFVTSVNTLWCKGYEKDVNLFVAYFYIFFPQISSKHRMQTLSQTLYHQQSFLLACFFLKVTHHIMST